ncbi:gliding motility lipoprotein GldH [Echinicola sp. CAU 1574]|uniref:Gliding motility lipoprotein GldH n=2 Tax=Echinicola arenosa TaxID=2774144 RepID=A0ABR9ANH1_9BACT|nr:gliding motility lipoprotein GldH [Echinicola arenosa]
MISQPMLSRLVTLALILTSFSACNNSRVYEEYQGMQKMSWAVTDTVTFEVDSHKERKVLSTFRVKYNDSYDYQNLYVRYILKDSLNNTLDNELLNLNLFDPKTGKPLGEGFGNAFTQIDTLPLKNLSTNSKIKVQLIQYMRSNELKGIESVGIKLEKE